MANPKVILWTSVKRLVEGFFYKGDGINVGIGQTMGWCPLLNFMKNSYLFDKFVIELVAL